MTLLERLKELNAAATPGPWDGEELGVAVYKTPIGDGKKICDIRGWGWLLHKHATDEAREAEQNANMFLIAESRNALPLLLELAEAGKALRTADVAFYEAKGVSFYENRRLFERTRDAEERLDAVLAKLEVEA